MKKQKEPAKPTVYSSRTTAESGSTGRSVIADHRPGSEALSRLRATMQSGSRIQSLQRQVAKGAEESGSKLPSEIGTNKVVQRKVGFEFQAFGSVTFPLDRDKKLHHTNNDQFEALFRQDIGMGDGFRVQGDVGAKYLHGTKAVFEPEMEIITNPVEETENGRGALSAQMNLITKLAGGIKHNGKLKNLVAGSVLWDRNLLNQRTEVHGSVHFHPQATVGVKFSKIADLIRALTSAPYMTGGEEISERTHEPYETYTRQFGWSGKEDQRPFRDAWAAGIRKAEEALQSKGASPKAVGFAAVLFGFAEVSKKKIELEYHDMAKYYTPLLFRTTLLPFYDLLTLKDKKLIFEHLSLEVMNQRVTPISDYTIESLLKMLEISEYPKIFIKDKEEKIRETFGLRHIYDIGNSDKEKNRDGALIELRKLGNDVPPGKLKSFALAVFDLIRMINAPEPDN